MRNRWPERTAGIETTSGIGTELVGVDIGSGIEITPGIIPTAETVSALSSGVVSDTEFVPRSGVEAEPGIELI